MVEIQCPEFQCRVAGEFGIESSGACTGNNRWSLSASRPSKGRRPRDIAQPDHCAEGRGARMQWTFSSSYPVSNMHVVQLKEVACRGMWWVDVWSWGADES